MVGVQVMWCEEKTGHAIHCLTFYLKGQIAPAIWQFTSAELNNQIENWKIMPLIGLKSWFSDQIEQ
jgi:hypothetical protein